MIKTFFVIMCAAVMLPRSIILENAFQFSDEGKESMSNAMKKSDSYIHGSIVYSELVKKGELTELTKDAIEYMEKCKALTKGDGMQRYAHIPKKYDGNHQVYKMLENVCDFDRMSGYIPRRTVRSSISNRESTINIVTDHMGNSVSDGARMKFRLMMREGSQDEVMYDSIANYLEETLNEIRGDVRKHASKSHLKSREEILTEDFSEKKPIKIYFMNKLVYVKILRRSSAMANLFKDYRSDSYLMRVEHLERVISLLRVYKKVPNVIAGFKSIEGRQKFIKGFISKINTIGASYPHELPSFLKAAKQMIFLDNDKSGVIGKSATSYYREGISDSRLEQSEKIKDFVTQHISDYKESINFLNIYKALAHPDIKMDDMFEQIHGSKDTNPIKDDVIPRFRGALLRDVTRSLMAQGLRPRFSRIDPESKLGCEIAYASKSNKLIQSKLADYSYLHWSNLKFDILDGFAESFGYVSKVSNKSSSCPMEDVLMSAGDINKTNRFTAGSNAETKLHNVNDYLSVLKGEDELDLTRASVKFEKVVKLFEAKESALGRDMTSAEISEFIDSNLGDMYLVMTEPKLLEVHKENSRVFYMAQQALKAIQQHFERIAKKLSSKQEGVSITRNYVQRRAEIEDMAHSYTGHPGARMEDDSILDEDDIRDIDPIDFWVAYLSFDMSEFSKKFPDKLIRVYGAMIRDLTGIEWLSRPDLLFKSCVVGHNTRGYRAAISGILGGFEGFLNFMWTSIHSVVMSIALEQTGNRGLVSTYSDDGLGRILYGKSCDPYSDLMKIQKVYYEHGLVFHVTKTVYSPDIWEYLGTMCVKGMIVDEWCKSYFKIGLDKKKKGFSPIMDIVSSIDSQGVATVNQGAPPCMIQYTTMNYILNYLMNRFPYMDGKILTAMTMIPASCGGLGLTTLGKLHLSSQITTVSEFASNLELMANYNGDWAGIITKVVFDNLKDSDDALSGVLAGPILQTYLRSSTSDSIICGLISKANSSAGADMPEEVFSSYEVRELKGVALRAQKLNIRTFQRLLLETPNAKRYATARIGMTSTASLQLLGRDTIKRAQNRDTKNFNECYQFWFNSLKSGKVGEVMRPREFLDTLMHRLYPMLKTTRLKESHRTCLTISGIADADIVCDVNFKSSGRIWEQSYYEPVKRFIDPVTPAVTLSESVDNFKARMSAKFAVYGARMLASEPRSLGIYVGVCNALKIRTGFPPLGMISSLHRSASTSFGRSDVSSVIPTTYIAHIQAQITSKLYDMIKGRGDRTTLCQAAISSTYHNMSSYISEDGSLGRFPDKMMYKIRDPEVNVSNESSDSYESPSPDLTDNMITRIITEEVQSLVEYNKASVNENGQIGVMSMINDIGEGNVMAILTKGMSDYLWNICGMKTKGRARFNISSIPKYYSVTIISNAITDVAFNMSPRLTKNLLIRSILRYESLCNPGTVGEGESLDILRRIIEDLCEKDPAYMVSISNAIAVVRSLNYDESITSLFNELYTSSSAFYQSLIRTVHKFDRVNRDVTPVAVMALNTGLSRQFTNAHKKVVSDALDYLLRKEEMGYGDGILDNFHGIMEYLAMASAKDSLRPSKHRVTSYNNVACQARLLKAVDGIMKVLSLNITDKRKYYEFIGSYVTSSEDMRSYVRNWSVMRNEDRKDIQGILFSPVGSSSRKAILSVIMHHSNDARLKEILFGGFKKGNNISHIIRGVLTDYDRKVQSRISASIVTIDIHYSKIMNSESFLSQKDLVSLSRAGITERSVRGEVIEPREFFRRDENRSILNDIVMARAMTCSSWAEAVISIEGGYENDLKNDEGDVCEIQVMGSCARVSVRKYRELEDAMDTWAYVNSVPDSLSYIIKENDYYLTINIGEKLTQGGSKTEFCWATSAEIVSGGLITYSRVGLSKDVAMISRAMKNIEVEKDGGLGAMIASEAFTAASGSRVTVLNTDLTLAAIGAGTSGTWDMSNSVTTYLAVRAWMAASDPNDDEGVYRKFIDEVEKFEEYIEENECTLPKSVTGDISMTWQWVKKSGFSPGSNLSHEKVMRMASGILNEEFDIRVPTTLTTARPLPFSSVRESVKNIDEIEYGRVSDYLFTRTVVGKRKKPTQKMIRRRESTLKYLRDN